MRRLVKRAWKTQEAVDRCKGRPQYTEGPREAMRNGSTMRHHRRSPKKMDRPATILQMIKCKKTNIMMKSGGRGGGGKWNHTITDVDPGIKRKCTSRRVMLSGLKSKLLT